MLAEHVHVTAGLALIRNPKSPWVSIPQALSYKQYYLLSYEPSIHEYYILYIVADQATNSIFSPLYWYITPNRGYSLRLPSASVTQRSSTADKHDGPNFYQGSILKSTLGQEKLGENRMHWLEGQETYLRRGMNVWKFNHKSLFEEKTSPSQQHHQPQPLKNCSVKVMNTTPWQKRSSKP